MKAEKVFRFKQFSIRHERCAMKVGTDGVLLGAWVRVEGARTALDIGTGTGLIALMLAQRNPVLQIVGIDIDADAVKQAEENAENSPWPDRIHIEQTDFGHWDCTSGAFDLIVSNPPFFTEDTPSPNKARKLARQATSLPMKVLIKKAAELLSPAGSICLIVPTEQVSDVVSQASAHGLFLSQRTDVHTTSRKPAKRSLLALGRTALPTEHRLLTLLCDGKRTVEYAALTEAFYLERP